MCAVQSNKYNTTFTTFYYYDFSVSQGIMNHIDNQWISLHLHNQATMRLAASQVVTRRFTERLLKVELDLQTHPVAQTTKLKGAQTLRIVINKPLPRDLTV
jgi:hypothetical protein